MHLVEFQCDGFRCLRNVQLEPCPGLNVIRGNNAQGKTSLLEAVLFLTTSKSHRTNHEPELVAHDAAGFHLQGQARRHDRDVELETNWWEGAKRVRVNGVPQTRVSDILGRVNVVFFCPDDVTLVQGTASHRRRFLDMELSQLDGKYLTALQQYRLILRQRNELLRGDRPDPALLDAWDEQLAKHGLLLIAERQRYIEELSERAAETYGRIAQDEPFLLRYDADVPLGESLPDVLTRSRDADLRRNMTLRGPHRDDVAILVGGRSGRHFASQGQQKTAALALKLAEVHLAKDRTGEYPVLMLDEVGSDLDGLRRERLGAAIPEDVQCLLTTADARDEWHAFRSSPAHFVIRKGRLETE